MKVQTYFFPVPCGLVFGLSWLFSSLLMPGKKLYSFRHSCYNLTCISIFMCRKQDYLFSPPHTNILNFLRVSVSTTVTTHRIIPMKTPLVTRVYHILKSNTSASKHCRLQGRLVSPCSICCLTSVYQIKTPQMLATPARSFPHPCLPGAFGPFCESS